MSIASSYVNGQDCDLLTKVVQHPGYQEDKQELLDKIIRIAERQNDALRLSRIAQMEEFHGNRNDVFERAIRVASVLDPTGLKAMKMAYLH